MRDYILFINQNLVPNLEIYVNDELLGSDGQTYENIVISVDIDKYGRPLPVDVDFKFIATNGAEFITDQPIIMNYNQEWVFIGSTTEKTGVVGLDWRQQTDPIKIDIADFELTQVGDIDESNYLPFTNIYKITPKELGRLSSYRFGEIGISTSEGVEWKDNPNDPANYINEIFKIPFNIKRDSVEQPEPEQNIIIGDYRTDIKGQYLDSYTHNLDLGNIVIDKYISQNIGYKNIEINLFVPNFDLINLSVERVMGCELNLILVINLITGKGTLNIIDVENESIILTETQQVAERVPYEIKGVHLEIGNSVVETLYETPYIEIKSLIPNNEMTLENLSSRHLNTQFDYLIDDDKINIKSFATAKEQELIKNNIRNGIFVRKGG